MKNYCEIQNEQHQSLLWTLVLQWPTNLWGNKTSRSYPGCLARIQIQENDHFWKWYTQHILLIIMASGKRDKQRDFAINMKKKQRLRCFKPLFQKQTWIFIFYAQLNFMFPALYCKCTKRNQKSAMLILSLFRSWFCMVLISSNEQWSQFWALAGLTAILMETAEPLRQLWATQWNLILGIQGVPKSVPSLLCHFECIQVYALDELHKINFDRISSFFFFSVVPSSIKDQEIDSN